MDDGQEVPRYYSTYGPESGPLRERDVSFSMGVYAEPGACWPIGRAHPAAGRADPRGTISRFWLVVHGAELPGLWECWNRAFRPAVEADE